MKNNMGNNQLQYARRFSTSIAPRLGTLPDFVIDGDRALERVTNLAERTLLKGKAYELPSGQSAARHIMANDFPRLGIPISPVVNSGQDDPLWIYVLAEAQTLHQGQRLGPLASFIVASTIARILSYDHTSYLFQQGWQPSLPRKAGTDFQLRDLIRYALG